MYTLVDKFQKLIPPESDLRMHIYISNFSL